MGTHEHTTDCRYCRGTGKIIGNVTCNRCGENRVLPNGYNIGGCRVVVEGTYGSTALRDCTSYRFGLCEACCTWLFEQFKVPVEIGEYGTGTGETPWPEKTP